MNTPTINADARMLDCALFYAKRFGWAVFPVHVPIHNAAGECVGCTCEHYRQSDECKANHPHIYLGPDGKCPQPGKCPAVRWREKSTTAETQIRKWWGPPWRAGDVKFFPNIGLDCGKSGLLVHDADSYKPDYAGADYLSMADRQTATAITGSGGEHLFYQANGAPYGNANGTLPYGNDIRGLGGYVVLAPSLHKTGRRGQWEGGYSPRDTALLPIPSTLAALLDTAHQHKPVRFTSAVTFGAVGVDAPDLARWELSDHILDMIHSTAEKGKRSEHDACVVTALCAAGAGDDDILAVFAHYPVGLDGKYAERGADYLARTITSCRAYLTEQEVEHQRTQATIAALRLWGQTHSFSDRIPPELRGEHYRTDKPDTLCWDAICDRFQKTGQLRIQIGKKRLAAMAGLGSSNTAQSALARLVFAFDVQQGDKYGMWIALRADFRLIEIDPLLSPMECDKGINFDQTEIYSQRKATDPFLSGTSRTVKERCKGASSVAGGTFKDWLATIPKAYGEACLRVLTALGREGDSTIVELAEATGKKIPTLRGACRLLEQRGRIESSRENSQSPKVYSLGLGVFEAIDTEAPSLRTYGLSAEREAKRLKAAQQWAVQEQAAAITAGDKAIHDQLERRLTRLGNQRLKVLGHIYPTLPTADLATLAFDVQIPQAPHPALLAKLKRLHANARMDLAEQRRHDEWALTDELRRMRTEGLDKRTAVRHLEYAGYTPTEAWAAADRVWPKAVAA